MEQHVLINEVAELVGQARDHENCGRPSAANASLVKLHELLTGQLASDTTTDRELEEKLNPDE